MTNGYLFEHLVLAYTIELMDDLGLIAIDSDFDTQKFHEVTCFEIFGFL